MSGVICIAVLLGLYLLFGWAGVLWGTAVELVALVLIARRAVDREDAALIARAQGRE